MIAHPQDQRDAAPPAMLRVGRIAGAHGLGGALRVRPDNPDSELFAHATRITLVLSAERREHQVIAASRVGGGMIRLILNDISDADQADGLKGADVMIAQAELPPAGPREFYHYQAVGCEVVLTDGRRLGVVTEVMATGANDVLVVRDGKKETLVPVIADVIKAMDLEARRIEVEPVPGLLE
ncbi:MAG TPA: ribosome maturation factor RimM [Candidatus Binataceae bacterium]|nr:ribosome maturation factor RimM [Candidatus Binataceae bacterium]